MNKFLDYTVTYSQKIGILSPKLLNKIIYYIKFKKFPDLKNPITLNEKLLWLEFNTDTSSWTTNSDKFLVREHLKKLGLEKYLVKLYGAWDRAEDIDFDSLPDKFILKTNHGYGGVVVVEDKSKIDRTAIIEHFKKSLKNKFGYTTGEPHYIKIHPKVMAEELLPSPKGDKSVVDYKFWCFNGEPDNCLVCTNRDFHAHTVNFMHYTLDPWEKHAECIIKSRYSDDYVPRPENLEEMLDVCRALSKNDPLVRVDLYNVDGKIYFGELTYTGTAGRMTFYTDDTLVDLGNKVKL